MKHDWTSLTTPNSKQHATASVMNSYPLIEEICLLVVKLCHARETDALWRQTLHRAISACVQRAALDGGCCIIIATTS
ncbi:hypothetical protein HW555_003440 [Spodoptera exigua]|uniref:Uncharacterized protein n=1 Tax=Spodoptera exigua TaxID=7107 RepID=A0A835GLX6_SPOEX|nr:hypothetical protein HW555_003440 [Spodoptera exigua]